MRKSEIKIEQVMIYPRSRYLFSILICMTFNSTIIIQLYFYDLWILYNYIITQVIDFFCAVLLILKT